ncbi:cell wall-active antibiotics response protein LiaF [Psychrobacillus sp.]|uniref:cell wall-active antibiotics response protein LiaF n=1 Tax=Psychrobacillus sp. TaxID=1871623 RepID=UPI0028BDDEEC|nr:cell wall-active antibiotics response protein LiaF [Psychrobacillus sp.]
MKDGQTNKLAFILICFVFLMFIEATIFGNGSIVLVLLGIGMIYFSLRRRARFLFWTGFIFIIMAIFSMWSLRLLLIAIMMYALYKLWKNEPIRQIIKPFDTVYKETPNSIIQNKLFSAQTTPFNAYEWQDVHVQSFYGEHMVDVTQTVLPKGTSFISIRQSLGKVTIYVPYEVPVRVHYATIIGEANIFGRGVQRLWNQSVVLKDGYLDDVTYASELVITVSTWIGDIEVVRK